MKSKKERNERMRELIKKNTHRKGKRIVAGVIAVVLAIMAAIPLNFPVIEVNAEDVEGKVKNSVEIVGGNMEGLEYIEWRMDKSGEKEECTPTTIEKNLPAEATSMELGEERISKITVHYKPEDGYILESVIKDGEELEENAYSQEEGVIT